MSGKSWEHRLGEFTLREKMNLLAGADMWRTCAIPRLGLPAIQLSDGPNGVRGVDDNLEQRSVCLPSGVALGATWNRQLVREGGALLAAEARRRGVQVLLAPTVNIQRMPNAGRNFECYSEDPLLTGQLAAAYIRGLQAAGVAACIKHFVANDQEQERFSISCVLDERALHEIYLEPFRVAIETAKPWTVMSAYNRLNGIHASEHPWLLQRLLKENWAYDGAVVSDWYGTYGDGVVRGGLDLEMPGPARWMAPDRIRSAMDAGDIDEAHIDEKVRRLLRLVDRVSAAPREWAEENSGAATVPLRLATESIVLLKNDRATLPVFTENIRRIVVVGEHAEQAQITGGGSAFVNPTYTVTPLQGIRSRVGADVQVDYLPGVPVQTRPPLLPPEWMRTPSGGPGLELSYFDELDCTGPPRFVGTADRSELTWFGTVNPYVDPSRFSMRLRGTLTVPESGTYRLHIHAIGRLRVVLDETVLIDGWNTSGEQEHERRVPLVASSGAELLIEYASDPNAAWRTLRLGCAPEDRGDPIAAAEHAVRSADLAIVMAGHTRDWETEGADRPHMKLLGDQDELIARVAAACSRTVVVLATGSPVEMPWLERVPAVLQGWYAGQDAGTALAAVLFGDQSPSGRLPMSWPRRLKDTPAYLSYPGEAGTLRYAESLFVGYRFYDTRDVEPLFPFGHGLSYTRFEYSDLLLPSGTVGPGEVIPVELTVRNSGQRPASDVVQVYLHDPESTLRRPEQELAAFEKVRLAPGEQTRVRFELEARLLAFWDSRRGDWVVEPGTFEVRVGRSSRDIRCRARFEWVDPDFKPVTTDSDSTQFSTVAT